jgi:hypothetical protein
MLFVPLNNIIMYCHISRNIEIHYKLYNRYLILMFIHSCLFLSTIYPFILLHPFFKKLILKLEGFQMMGMIDRKEFYLLIQARCWIHWLVFFLIDDSIFAYYI